MGARPDRQMYLVVDDSSHGSNVANPDGSTRRPWFLQQPIGSGSFETGRFSAQEWSDGLRPGDADELSAARDRLGVRGRRLANAAFAIAYLLIAVPIAFFAAVFVTFSVADAVHTHHRPVPAVTDSSHRTL
jgi:hypothetical protein